MNDSDNLSRSEELAASLGMVGVDGSRLAALGSSGVSRWLVGAAILYGGPAVRRRMRHRRGLCAKCGYNLTGNVSGVCPECGTPIEQAEAKP